MVEGTEWRDRVNLTPGPSPKARGVLRPARTESDGNEEGRDIHIERKEGHELTSSCSTMLRKRHKVPSERINGIKDLRIDTTYKRIDEYNRDSTEGGVDNRAPHI